MWLGMLMGGGLGWVAVQRTADGSMSRYLVDERTAWLYVAGLAAVLAVGVATGSRFVAGVAAGLAVGLAIAAGATMRPDAATPPDLGPPLGAAAAFAFAAALGTGMAARTRDTRHPVRRPWSRRAMKERTLQARH